MVTAEVTPEGGEAGEGLSSPNTQVVNALKVIVMPHLFHYLTVLSSTNTRFD